MSLAFTTSSASHVGMVRQINEDCLLARSDIGLWAVADGMGGHGGGDLASGALIAALDSIKSSETAADLLAQFEHRVVLANDEVRTLAHSKALGVIGTTLVAILIRASHYACLWCGDSRGYLWRGGVLTQLTHDHSETQDLVDRGVLDAAEAKSWPRRNVVTRAIGVAAEAELELERGRVVAGDRFLLCSDGLTNHVADEEIAAAISGSAPHKACDSLVALTLQRGATDNVSLIIIACDDATRTIRDDGSWRAEAIRAGSGGGGP